MSLLRYFFCLVCVVAGSVTVPSSGGIACLSVAFLLALDDISDAIRRNGRMP